MDRKPFAAIRMVPVHHSLWAGPNSVATQRITMWLWRLTRWGYIVITIYVMCWLCTENVVKNILIVSFIWISRSFSTAMRFVHVKCSSTGHEFFGRLWRLYAHRIALTHIWRRIVNMILTEEWQKSGERQTRLCISWASEFSRIVQSTLLHANTPNGRSLYCHLSRLQAFHTKR